MWYFFEMWGKRVLIPSCCMVGIYMNETSVSGRRAVMLSTGLMEILTAWSHDSFCFNFCIHTLIWALRSLSSVASSSMQAMMTILFVRQMLVILDNSPLGRLKLEVYATFLKITHIC